MLKCFVVCRAQPQVNPFSSSTTQAGGNLFANIIQKQQPQAQPMMFSNNNNNTMQVNNVNNQMFGKPQFGGGQTIPNQTPIMQQIQQPLQNLMTNTNKFSQLMQVNTNSNMAMMNNNNQMMSQQKQQQSLYYSNQMDLNDDDMKEYGADEFSLGRIPFNPPSENLIRRF